MKKLNLKLENLSLKKLDLVKGCPTDINSNGQEDDDYNQDGQTNQADESYYDGYYEGYYNGNDQIGPEYEHVNPYDEGTAEYNAYEAGVSNGEIDHGFDQTGSDGVPWFPNQDTNGPDIDTQDFVAPTNY